MGAACSRRRGLIGGGLPLVGPGRGAAFLADGRLGRRLALAAAFAGGRSRRRRRIRRLEVAGAALAGDFLADVADFFTAGAGFVDFFAAAIVRPPPWAQIERRNIAAPSRSRGFAAPIVSPIVSGGVRTTRGP